MAKDYPRSNQIGQQIKKEIAEILQYEIQHPTLANVTITDLELSRDLRHAKIYFISKMNKLKSLFSYFITLIEKHFLILKKSYQKNFLGPLI